MAGRERSEQQLLHLISLDEARRKCDENHSCFVRVESVEHICLAPSFLGRLKAGVQEQLNTRLMKYSDQLQCVPVAYEGLQLMRRHGTVVEEQPFIHFDIRVNFIVFKPVIGSTLVGVVNKIGLDHIGCLVHGSFNASIARPRDRNGFSFRELEMGSEFEFRVVGFEAVNGVVLISGAIDECLHKYNRSKKNRRHLVGEGSGVKSKGKVTGKTDSAGTNVKNYESSKTDKKKMKTNCASQDSVGQGDKLKSRKRTSEDSEKKSKKRKKIV